MTNKSIFQKIRWFVSDTFHSNDGGVISTSVWMFLSQLITFGCQFISGIILARILQPEGRGQYAILVLIPTCTRILGDLALGIPVGFFSAKDPSLARPLNANSFFAAFFLTLIYSSIMFALHYFGLLGTFTELLPLGQIILISAALFFLLSLSYSQSLLLGTNFISAKNALHIMEPLIFIGFLTVLAILGYLDVWWAFSAWVATRALSFVVSTLFLIKLNLFSLKPDFKLFIQSLKMGTKGIPAEIAGFIILQSDLFMLRHFTGDDATGIYSIAASLSFILMSIPQSIGLALFPNISKIESVPGVDGTEKTIKFCRITIIITIFISIAAMILAPFTIKFLYGESFAKALYPFLILAVAVSVVGFTHVLNAQLYARDAIWVTTLCALVAAAINIALNIILIPKYSFMGAAYSSIISYAFFGVVLSYFYAKIVKRPVSVLIPRGEDFQLLYSHFCGFLAKVKAKL